jgi:CRISPR-associated protein Cas2
MDVYLVAYDIPDDKRRNKIADLLQDYGKRVQYSVFELWMKASHRKQFEAKLKHIIDAEQDSIRIYHLCHMCCERVTVFGKGTTPQEPDTWII